MLMSVMMSMSKWRMGMGMRMRMGVGGEQAIDGVYTLGDPVKSCR